MFNQKNSKRNTLLSLFMALLLLTAVACSSAGSEPAAEDNNDANGSIEEMDAGEEMDHDEEMDHNEDMDHEHDEDHAANRIPNPGGAAIRITSPADGDEFAEGSQIIVDVEVDNFSLGEDGSHWHVYVDGTSFGMVVGGNTDQPLNGVDPGEHEVSVYLANGDHEEFEEGDSITVVVK